MRRQVLVAMLLVGVNARAADAPPSMIPTQDVDVVYRLQRTGKPKVRVRVRWLAEEKLERVDGPGRTVTLANRGRGDVTLLNPASKTYTQLDAPPTGMFFPGLGASAEQGPRETIVGHECTQWHWTEEDQLHSLCITDDGLMLQSASVPEFSVTAVSVRYGKSPPRVFRVPPGYGASLAPDGPVE